jgi:hypothetical protein
MKTLAIREGMQIIARSKKHLVLKYFSHPLLINAFVVKFCFFSFKDWKLVLQISSKNVYLFINDTKTTLN